MDEGRLDPNKAGTLKDSQAIRQLHGIDLDSDPTGPTEFRDSDPDRVQLRQLVAVPTVYACRSMTNGSEEE